MLLWDLEVARRLYQENGNITHRFDSLPIGVAIAVINHLMETDHNCQFHMEFIYQIFEDERRKEAVEVILENLAFGSAPKAATGQVRV